MNRVIDHHDSVVEHKSVDTAEYKIDYYSGKTYFPPFKIPPFSNQRLMNTAVFGTVYCQLCVLLHSHILSLFVLI